VIDQPLRTDCPETEDAVTCSAPPARGDQRADTANKQTGDDRCRKHANTIRCVMDARKIILS